MDRYHEAVQQGVPGIPLRELRDHLRDAAEAIDFLNEPRHQFDSTRPAGIQHCDIKPQNLLLVGGRIKVADFGLARLLAGTVASHTGSMTPAYAAPEFFRNETSSQSDQYSLAVTYCQLRCGKLPFTGPPEAVMAGHLRNKPDLSMLPSAERAAVARALAKESGARWTNCRAFLEAIYSASSGDASANVPGVSRLKNARELLHRIAGARRRVALAVLLVLAMAAISVAAYFELRPNDPTSEARLHDREEGPAHISPSKPLQLPLAEPAVLPQVTTIAPISALKISPKLEAPAADADIAEILVGTWDEVYTGACLSLVDRETYLLDSPDETGTWRVQDGQLHLHPTSGEGKPRVRAWRIAQLVSQWQQDYSVPDGLERSSTPAEWLLLSRTTESKVLIMQRRGLHPREPLWTYGFDVNGGRDEEAGFSKAPKLGIEVFWGAHEDVIRYGLYVSEVGSFALAHRSHHVASPKQLKWAFGVALPAKGPAKEQGIKNSRFFGIEVFHDSNFGNWIYVTEKGMIAVTPSNPKAPDPQRAFLRPMLPISAPTPPKLLYTLDMRCRKAGHLNWSGSDNFHVDVYSDHNTGSLIYVCDTGAISVLPDSGAPTRPADGKGPIWLRAFDLSVRDFAKNGYKLRVEVFRDQNNGNLIYLSQKGFLAVMHGKERGAPVLDTRGPRWLCELKVRCRTAGETQFSQETRGFSAELFRERERPVTLFIGENGSITGISDSGGS